MQDVGEDLACSACTLSAHTIEREVLPLQKHQSKDTGTPKESIHTSKYEQQVYENQRQEQQPGL